MREVISEIVINTQSSRVWDILVNLEKYVAWNPFIKEAEGEVKENAQLRVYIAPPDQKGRTLRPRITRLVENSELRLQSRFMLPGIFDTEYVLELVPLTHNSIKLVQRAVVSGILVPFYGRSTLPDVKKGFDEMNYAVKQRAEEQVRNTT